MEPLAGVHGSEGVIEEMMLKQLAVILIPRDSERVSVSFAVAFGIDSPVSAVSS